MKIYLSKYWIADHISLVCVEVVIVVATAAFCAVCKEASAKGNQIIMPYNQKSKPLLHLRDWHKVCFY